MTNPRVLVLTGYGINCDDETQFAFQKAGARAEKVHINDLIATPNNLKEYQILVFPGGFSYGDDTGAGIALANKIRNHLWEEVRDFVDRDRLVQGICNGFQVLVNLGLVPALGREYGTPQAALVHNNCARYLDRWVDLSFLGNSPWTRGISSMSLPIAHGEGKFYADAETLKAINTKGLVAARYCHGHICSSQNLPANPNGSLDDIAGIIDPSGRVLGMMPHPERAVHYTQHPSWTLLREHQRRSGLQISEEGLGMQIFRNGVEYFR
ncbi:MAG: phosphoribosylformylglycinamidine synthase I [Nanoarchaeota archaeon]|nr:phosphoribosylformylglycinamidine synthase I [Nanoarchaeota archaeon]MBU4086685.1 phosphoribosylformylglycinamidine synthase I [Nanoarchaeota archaeon]